MIDLEPKARAVAREAEEARGVVAEAALVKHAQASRGEVRERVVGRLQDPSLRSPEWHRDRVDREVAAREVLGDGAGPDLGQGARVWVALRAALRDVDPQPCAPLHDRGAEAIVHGRVRVRHALGELGDEPCGVAAHDHVELSRLELEQQVAHRAADERDVGVLACHLEQLCAAGLLGEALDHDLAVHHAVRTGMPAAARCSFACATVKRP